MRGDPCFPQFSYSASGLRIVSLLLLLHCHLGFITENDSWTSWQSNSYKCRSTFRHPRPVQGLHPSPPFTHENTYTQTPSTFCFCMKLYLSLKVSCYCCYCLTIIATLRGNFTIFESHEPTIVHLCTNCHLLIF